MRRIYLEIYLSVVVTALLATIGLGFFGHWYFDGRLEADRARLREIGAGILAELPEGASPGELDEVLTALAGRRDVSAVLWDAEGEVLATAGPGVRPGLRSEMRPRPRRRPGPHFGSPRDERRGDPAKRGHRGPAPWAWASLEVPGGGLLEIASSEVRPPPRLGPWLFAGILLGSIAIAAYPVSRRITRGLERLREGVSEFGEGDLTTRVEIHGHNEVADVARAFNDAAEKIQRGAEAQRRLLASASHELRSPLGRLRAAVELLAAGQSDRLSEAERNIEELDALIEDLLLAARFEAAPSRPSRELVDLHSLLREEADRVDATLSAEASTTMEGDAHMLRRLVRNLLENASRHGAPPITIQLDRDEVGDTIRIRVSDAGGGVPVEERSRIFEPFYRPAGHSESRDGGVGLGLALVADIAAHHGGVAQCLPHDSLGSVFEVVLPATQMDDRQPV